MNIVGLFCTGPNPAACLVKDGELIAFCEEERFARVKQANGYMPVRSLSFCLKRGKISLKEVDHIAIGWDSKKYPDYMAEFAKKSFPPRLKRDLTVERIHSIYYDKDFVIDSLKFALRGYGIFDSIPPIQFVEHHRAHAASVFYPSPFDEALILTIDASGEENATVIWEGKGDNIKCITEINLPNSLGWFYSAMTEFIGFSAYTGEGKLMGLAAYGKPNMEYREKLSKVLKIENGFYQLDPTCIYFGEHDYRARFTNKLISLLKIPPRVPELSITEQYTDLAFESQFLLEEAVISLVKKYTKQTGLAKVCLSGGVAANCKMNGAILQNAAIDDLNVSPVPYDAGTALGGALILSKELGYSPRITRIKHAYWGPNYTNSEIENILNETKISYKKSDNVALEAAESIAEGKFVGWFQGRGEIGARALGSRSILANPSLPETKDKINREVKHREGFRPFAPSIMKELHGEYLQSPTDSDFMLMAFKVRPEKKSTIIATVHVDDTVRSQTVSPEINKLYYDVIKNFKDLTGIGAILNTSFNVRGEPIVNSPLDALRCFYGTGLDMLVMGDYIIQKKN